MATIPKTGIVNGQTADASQVTNIIDALDGTTNNEINILGTLSLPDITDVSASIANISSSVAAVGVSGSNQQVQFNNAGAFGASPDFTYNSLQEKLTVTNFDTDEITTTDINVGSALTTNIGTGAGSSTTIGSSTSGNLVLNGAGTVNIGLNTSYMLLGPTSGRMILSSAGINNTNKAYFYGNSGDEAFNVGYSSTNKNRVTISGFSNSSEIKLTGNYNFTGDRDFTINNYGNFTSMNALSGGTLYILNSFNTTSDISLGNSTTQNFKFIFYTAGNSDNSRPGSSGGSRGGLKIAHTLELGATKAYKTSGTTWEVTSDERVKENIIAADIDICYENVKNLPLKRFNYVDNYSENPIDDRTQLGWIAQDVSSVLPKAISSGSFTTWVDYSGEDITGSRDTIITSGSRVQDVIAGSEVIDDLLSLDSDQIIKMMYGAIQKLQAKVEALENK